MDLQTLAATEFCYLTTTGRRSGRSHTIEIWFALHGHTLYFLSGGGPNADWVKNMQHSSHVSVRIVDHVFVGQARLVMEPDEDALARQLVVTKYQHTEDNLAAWGRTALPVAVDVMKA